MSAAVPRAEKLEPGASESTRPAETCVDGRLEGRPIGEVTKVREAGLRSIGDDRMTPLMRAACDGLAGTVQALLARGAEVNARRSDGFNALALAAFFGHSQVVWLLLENGADLAATGRSETLPETWANARGFFDIGATLREARLTELVEVSSLSTAVIDESARFSRPVESGEVQPAGDPGAGVEVAAIDEAADSEVTLAMMPAPVVEEGAASRSESTADIFRSDKPENSQQQPVIKQSVRAVKTLPEIEDPPRLVVPRFHPGSAFVTRITSSPRNLVAVLLAVLLVCGGLAAFMFPQIRKSLGGRQTEVVTNTADLPPEPSNTVVGSETSVSGTAETPSASTTEPTAPAASEIEKNPAGTTVDKRDSAATSVSRSGTRTRKQQAVSRAVKFTPQTVPEEQSKPAPLSVETSRNPGVLSTPAERVKEGPSSQPPSLSIISGKPKTKVIQWP